MEHAPIPLILEEMNPAALREACKMRSIVLDTRNSAPYREALVRLDWSDNQKEDLIEILKKNRKRDETVFRSAQIAKSDDLPSISDNEIISALNSAPPKKTREGNFLSGFQDITSSTGKINGTFVGSTSRLIIIAKEALVEKKTIFVPFSIIRSEGHVLIKTSRPMDGRICREKLMEILNLQRLYFATPDGIREDGISHTQYNSKAKDFIASLEIEEINGVYLRIGGDTKIRSINYKGQGDILEEDKIKEDIRKGALIVGVKGLIRNGEPLIDFSINWWWIPLIRVSSEEISPEIADEVVFKIAQSYIGKILK